MASPFILDERSGGTYESLDSQEAIKEAEANGGLVIYPSDMELFCDLDSEESVKIFDAGVERLKWMIGVSSKTIGPSRSPGKFHGTVRLSQPVKSNTERILLQACLGSDPLRELLSYARVMKRDPHPTLFIEGGTKPDKSIPKEDEELPF
jgi:hypothetical protein